MSTDIHIDEHHLLEKRVEVADAEVRLLQARLELATAELTVARKRLDSVHNRSAEQDAAYQADRSLRDETATDLERAERNVDEHERDPEYQAYRREGSKSKRRRKGA